MPRTFVETVASRHVAAGGRSHDLSAGDVVWLRPSRLMTHDNSSAIHTRFRSMGAVSVADPAQLVIVIDHDIQNRSPGNLAKYASIEAFAKEQDIELHPAGSGIGHQVMLERGHAKPGELCVAADSHANTYGAVGALGVAVTRSDAAGIWASGMFWWEIPESVKVELTGRLAPGVAGKDVALCLCALYPDDVLGACVEFRGAGAASLSADDRLTLSNMTTEWGASAGVFPDGFDSSESEGARYRATITLDLSEVAPLVSGPDTLGRAVPVVELMQRPVAIQKAYLVSCANGRVSDFESAAAVLRGRRVAGGVSLYIAAASASVQAAAERSGAWGALLDAGAIPLPSGCGPCIGLGAGLLLPGETGISASNRNYKGRMGSPDARCYLGSPATVAASAADGFIRGASKSPSRLPDRSIVHHDGGRPRRHASEESCGRITGRLVAFLRDDIDTDALCPARLVYADGASSDELKRGLFSAIAPAFAGSVKLGDVLVAGARFGCGSSREQAVTALKAAGISAVVAGSFAPSFRRNAWNNGFPAIERPELVASLRARFPDSAEVARFTDESIVVELSWLPAVGRDLYAAGGLDAFLHARSPRDDA